MTVTNVTPPTISGTARKGSTLTTSNGTWTYDLDYLTYAYQWMRCDAAGANCIDIGGATNSSYVLQQADVGSRIRSEVTATENAHPTPGPGDELSWAPPTVGAGGVAVVNFTLTNATRSSSSILGNGAGRDLVITNTEVLTGPVTEIRGWRHVVWIGGAFGPTASGSDGHVIPRNIQGTFHLEGIKFVASASGDFITHRWGSPSSIIQIQNCYGEISHFNTSHHSDWFQTQESLIGQLRFDKCTILTDYQGFFINNETSSNPQGNSQVFHTTIRRTNFRPHPAGRTFNGSWFFKSIPPANVPTDMNNITMGPWVVDDVWVPVANAGSITYPRTNFVRYDGVAYKYGSFLETDVTSDYLRWSTPADTVPSGPYAGQAAADCGITGIVRLGTPADFCPSSVPGIGYVSPGYL